MFTDSITHKFSLCNLEGARYHQPMSQSLVKNYIHIVFSTKYRQKLTDSAIEDELYMYLGGIANNLGCIPIKIGGYQDHVHILCLLSKNITLATLMSKMKSNSSKWIKTKGEAYRNFYWQNGYGAFSVKASDIARQKEHHSRKTFQAEFRDYLEKNKMVFDERYVWD